MEKKIQDMGRSEFLELMKALQVDHLEPKLKSIVEEVMQAERSAFWVPAEKHYLAHLQFDKCSAVMEEKEANHDFVSRFRRRGNKAGEIAFYLLVAGACAWTAATFWGGFVAALQKMFNPGAAQ